MATLIQCIGEGQAANTLPEELAIELGGSLDKFIAKYIREGLDPSAARRMAQQDVIDAKKDVKFRVSEKGMANTRSGGFMSAPKHPSVDPSL